MLVYVPLERIDDNPYQERLSYEDVPELAGRIAAARDSYPDTFGLMQVPRGRLVVDQSGTVLSRDEVDLFLKKSNEKFKQDLRDLFRVQLAFGHRRLRAMRHLHQAGDEGYEAGVMPVHIDALTDEQMLDAVWAENYDRSDISPLERARLLWKKIQQPNGDGRQLTQADVARKWGMGRSTVANSLRLLELPTEVQVAVHDGQVSSRLALDLLPVAEMRDALEKIDGKIDWGKNPRATWGAPAHPDKFIEFALGGEATSDQVREYSKYLIGWIGLELPPRLMEFDCDQADGIQQPTCAGCPLLARKNICLHRAGDGKSPGLGQSCAAVKMQIVGTDYARQMAQKTGYEYSDNPLDFTNVSINNLGNDLLAAHEAGQRTDGMVIGWRDGWGVRPWGRGGKQLWRNRDGMLGQNMGAGLILGLRQGSTLVQDGEEGETAVYQEPSLPVPDLDTRNAWHQAYIEISDKQQLAIVEAVSTWLNESCPPAVRKFVNTLNERDGKVDIAEETVTRLLLRSPIRFNNPGELIESSAYFVELGVGISPLSPACIARLWANYGLWYWWKERNYQMWDGDKTAAAEILTRAHALRDDLTDELRDLVDEAIQDVADTRRRLGKEEPANDAVLCEDCGHALDGELGEPESCSCGRAVCQDCYLEEGHVSHDETRDPSWDETYNLLKDE
jgi:ParB/RepB/Spo0J family partition protein